MIISSQEGGKWEETMESSKSEGKELHKIYKIGINLFIILIKYGNICVEKMRLGGTSPLPLEAAGSSGEAKMDKDR